MEPGGQEGSARTVPPTSVTDPREELPAGGIANYRPAGEGWVFHLL